MSNDGTRSSSRHTPSRGRGRSKGSGHLSHQIIMGSPMPHLHDEDEEEVHPTPHLSDIQGADPSGSQGAGSLGAQGADASGAQRGPLPPQRYKIKFDHKGNVIGTKPSKILAYALGSVASNHVSFMYLTWPKPPPLERVKYRTWLRAKCKEKMLTFPTSVPNRYRKMINDGVPMPSNFIHRENEWEHLRKEMEKQEWQDKSETCKASREKNLVTYGGGSKKTSAYIWEMREKSAVEEYGDVSQIVRVPIPPSVIYGRRRGKTKRKKITPLQGWVCEAAREQHGVILHN